MSSSPAASSRRPTRAFEARIADGIHVGRARRPGWRGSQALPVTGAALLALDRLDDAATERRRPGRRRAAARARAELGAWRPA